MGHIMRIHSNQFAALKINSQRIASRDEHLKISLIAVDWPFSMLTHATIDNVKVRLNSQVHINNTLVNIEAVHVATIRTRQKWSRNGGGGAAGGGSLLCDVR